MSRGWSVPAGAVAEPCSPSGSYLSTLRTRARLDCTTSRSWTGTTRQAIQHLKLIKSLTDTSGCSQVLSVVMGDDQAANHLRTLLGPVELDGGADLGRVSPHLAQRYGFSPSCLVNAFTSDVATSALCHPLTGDIEAETADPAALVCLAVDERDSVLVPTTQFVPDLGWEVGLHPTRITPGAGPGGQSREPNYLTVIRCAGTQQLSVSARCPCPLTKQLKQERGRPDREVACSRSLRQRLVVYLCQAHRHRPARRLDRVRRSTMRLRTYRKS